VHTIVFGTLIILQYLLTVWTLRTRRFDLFICVYIYSLFTYDYIFINASYYFPSRLVALLKPYSEYLAIYFLYYLYFVQKKRISLWDRFDAYLIWFIILPTVVVIVANDLAGHRMIGETMLGMRLYLMPLVLAYLLYKCGILKDCDQLKIVNTIFIFSIFSGVYGFFQKAYFRGTVKDLWFYPFFTKNGYNPLDFWAANYIRDNRLRITGYYVSPITYSVAFCLPILIVLTIFANSYHKLSNHIRYLLLSFLLFFLWYQWFSQTRIGLIVDVIGALVIVYAKLKRPSFLRLILIPAAFIGFTFSTLLLKTTNDASALGRVDQYQAFLKYYTFFGLGFKHELVHTYFDTYFVSVGLLYGVFCIFPFLFIFKTLRAAYDVVVSNENNYFFEATFFLSLTFIYIFCFQFMAGSTPYRLYFLLLFVILANGSSRYNKSMQAHRYRLIPY
jgi:hypothetical protein